MKFGDSSLTACAKRKDCPRLSRAIFLPLPNKKPPKRCFLFGTGE